MENVDYILKNGRKPTKSELDFIKNETNITFPVWIFCLALLILINIILIIMLFINFSVAKLILVILSDLVGGIFTYRKALSTPKQSNINNKDIYILDVNYYEKTISLLNNTKINSFKIKTEDDKFNKTINYIYGDNINYINEVYEVNSKFSKPITKEPINIRYINKKGEEKQIEIANYKEYKHQSEGVNILYFAIINKKKNKIIYNAGINKKNID